MLMEARGLLLRGWSKGAQARDGRGHIVNAWSGDAASWSLVGALLASWHRHDDKLDEAQATAVAHPTEPKAREVLALYRDFLRRIATGELHLDYRKLAENAEVAKKKNIHISGRPDPRDGKILPVRASR